MGDMVIRNFIEDTPNAKMEMEAWLARNPACDVYLVIADESKRNDAFGGTVRSARRKGPDHVELTIAFDTPVDVVASPRFSSLRRHVSCTLGPTGRTVEKTSDGQPHMVLDLP